MSNDNAPQKLDLKSMDIPAANREKLKELFPSVFVESHNEKGEQVECIDFEKLKAQLGTFSDIFEGRRERYGMDWPGKKDVMKLIQDPSIATLKPVRSESVNFDDTENLFIEGDNLEVLKMLLKPYHNKVKMIYIDPPYNTGNEFIYPDDFKDSLHNYLELTGQTDNGGRRISANVETNGRYHTNWLNMMYPRLYLARNLLKEDGVIFISIDDNEVTNLRKLCDEIFGEENFVANIVWQKRTSPDMRKAISEGHENIIVYSKNFELCMLSFNKLPLTNEQRKNYKNPDNDPRGRWVSSDFTAQGYRPNQMYKIITPGGKEYFPPESRCWKNVEESFLQQVKEGRFWFGSDGNGVPRRKTYLAETEGRVPWTWWPNKEVGHTQEAKKQINALFEKAEVFSTPKPVSLIRRMLEITTKANDIILDFFSGSSTTAHAVLNLNKEDGGNRKFIMVQLPEPCEEKSEAFKAGYKTIADIGKERVRRAINKIETEQEERRKKEANKLPEMRTEIPQLDLGFKVFKLDKSCFKLWDGSNPNASEEELKEQLKLFADHILPDAGQEDILYEILLKAGFPPTVKVEKIKMAGKTVYSINEREGKILIYLEDEITNQVINAVANAEPIQFICLDRSFTGNDQLKANAVQTFQARNKHNENNAQILFRTV